MTAQVFPTLPCTWDIRATPLFNTSVQRSSGGKESRVGFWDVPYWEFELHFEILDQSSTAHAFKDLLQFFIARKGMLETFYWAYPNDLHMSTFSNVSGSQTVVDGAIQTHTDAGGHVTTVTIKTPYSSQIAVTTANTAPILYANGVVIAASTYTLTHPDAETLLFTFVGTKPANSVVITHSVPFFWVVRFDEDSADFSEFLHQLWELKTLKLKSVPDVVAP